MNHAEKLLRREQERLTREKDRAYEQAIDKIDNDGSQHDTDVTWAAYDQAAEKLGQVEVVLALIDHARLL